MYQIKKIDSIKLYHFTVIVRHENGPNKITVKRKNEEGKTMRIFSFLFFSLMNAINVSK